MCVSVFPRQPMGESGVCVLSVIDVGFRLIWTMFMVYNLAGCLVSVIFYLVSHVVHVFSTERCFIGTLKKKNRITSFRSAIFFSFSAARHSPAVNSSRKRHPIPSTFPLETTRGKGVKESVRPLCGENHSLCIMAHGRPVAPTQQHFRQAERCCCGRRQTDAAVQEH